MSLSDDQRKIYIVDDDTAILDSLGTLLDAFGYPVDPYGSARAFLEAFDPRWRGCLLLDIWMPQIDGLDLLRRINEQGSMLATVMITAHADVPTAVKAMKDGAVDFIEKPIDPDTILETIGRNLDGARRPAAAAPDAEASSRLSRLTPREHDVLKQMVVGLPNKTIAYDLGISPRTVEAHRARVMDKMEARSLSHLVRMALAAGVSAEN